MSATEAYVPDHNREMRRDRNRRRRWQSSVHQSKVSRGCRAWLMCLSERSSDTAKPVWGAQIKQGREIDCSDRQVRRYRNEAEHAKLIETRRSEPIRDHEGKFSRAMTNIYVFCVPPGSSNRRKSRSHRADTGVRLNHFLKEVCKTLGEKPIYKSDPACPECEGGSWLIDTATNTNTRCDCFQPVQPVEVTA